MPPKHTTTGRRGIVGGVPSSKPGNGRAPALSKLTTLYADPMPARSASATSASSVTTAGKDPKLRAYTKPVVRNSSITLPVKPATNGRSPYPRAPASRSSSERTPTLAPHESLSSTGSDHTPDVEKLRHLSDLEGRIEELVQSKQGLEKERSELDGKSQLITEREKLLQRRENEIEEELKRQKAELENKFASEKEEWIRAMKEEVQLQWSHIEDRIKEKDSLLQEQQRRIAELEATLAASPTPRSTDGGEASNTPGAPPDYPSTPATDGKQFYDALSPEGSPLLATPRASIPATPHLPEEEGNGANPPSQPNVSSVSTYFDQQQKKLVRSYIQEELAYDKQEKLIQLDDALEEIISFAQAEQS